MTALEGIVEEATPRQIGPGNAPGPLEPVVIDRVEAARQCKKELSERYPGITFSVTTERAGYSCMDISWDDGPESEEVELIADEYLGYYDDGDAQSDYFHYSPLPGKWVGGQFLRYDIAMIFYRRGTKEGMAGALRDWRAIWDEKLSENPNYTVSLGPAAGYLEITKEALVKLIKQGTIQANKTGIGKSWRVSVASLKAYWEARQR